MTGFRGTAMAMVALGAAMIATPAGAYTCGIPAIADVVKRTVCGAPVLRTLDRTEDDRLFAIRSVLAIENRALVTRDRRTFLNTRNACRTDARCLEATYRAQIRLYGKVEACGITVKNQAFCVTRAIQRHREELHRSQ